MKAELTLPPELVEEIADKVTERLKPLLSDSKKGKAEDTIFDVLKEIPHFHVGKYLRFKKSVIDKWIETQAVRPIPPLRSVSSRR